MARKVNLQEARKKIASHQHALDEDKRKLAKESAQLHLKQQAHAKALKDFSVGANP
jgi:hypothetical protein